MTPTISPSTPQRSSLVNQTTVVIKPKAKLAPPPGFHSFSKAKMGEIKHKIIELLQFGFATTDNHQMYNCALRIEELINRADANLFGAIRKREIPELELYRASGNILMGRAYTHQPELANEYSDIALVQLYGIDSSAEQPYNFKISQLNLCRLKHNILKDLNPLKAIAWLDQEKQLLLQTFAWTATLSQRIETLGTEQMRLLELASPRGAKNASLLLSTNRGQNGQDYP